MYVKLTAEETDRLERQMLIDMAARYRGGPRIRRRIIPMAATENNLIPSVDELVRVKQLPIIEEQLRAMKETIEQQTGEAMQLICNADTIQTVKDMRADLNRKFNALEDARKNVKKQIMAPYERFEETYRECVTDLFRRADADLKGKVDAVEGELKSICEQNLQAYFCELRDARGLPWLEYERAGIRVDMTSARAKTPKKLMDALRLFVDGVAANVKMIEGMDDAPEIMAEYKASLDAAASIATVQQRKKRIEAERQAAEERARREAERAAAAPPEPVVTPAPAPVPAYEPPKAVQAAAVKRYQLELRVSGTLEQMKLIKMYLKNNGLDYQSISFKEV